MKASGIVLLVLVSIVAAGGVGFWFGHRASHPAGAEKDEEKTDESKPQEPPVASVTVVPVRRGVVTQQIIAYGTVVAPPSEVRVVSVPFESRVTKMLVAPGEVVAAGQPLVEVEGSTATTLAFQEAQNTAAAAQRDVQLARQRFEQRLATNQELYTAESALQLAQGRLRSLQQGGAGGPRQLKAEAAGIVSKVDVQRGQIVPAGNPLVEVAAKDRIEVRLAADPEDVPFLKPDQPVELTPVDDPAAGAAQGKIRLIGQRVDPATRLVDVVVSLPSDAKLLLETFVAGKMAKQSAEGLVVPREAVISGGEDGGFTLFTVKDAKAVKHSVKLAVENDQDAQVVAEDVKEGDLVVVQGNAQLEEDMLVKAAPAATTQTAATAPATTEAAP